MLPSVPRMPLRMSFNGPWRRWSRRDFLRGVAVGAVGVALPPLGCGPGKTAPPVTTGFFTADEAAALGRLADFVLPPDATYPGGSELGTVAYVEQLLTSMDGPTPLVFRGGPYSGRSPFPDANGLATTQSPPDAFDDFLPLDRIQTAAWNLRLYGSNGVSGGGPNDAVPDVGPTVGMRDQMKQLLDQVLTAAPAIATMTDTQVANVWAALSSTQSGLVTELVVEAAFGAPEYGGNVGLGGWALSHFPGDQAPFGYSRTTRRRRPTSSGATCRSPGPTARPTRIPWTRAPSSSSTPSSPPPAARSSHERADRRQRLAVPVRRAHRRQRHGRPRPRRTSSPPGA